jgi:hypothetical protein
MAFSAFLDTCVLVPGRARDVFGPLWSWEIFRELDCTLRRLENSFPDAMVTGWEQIESAIDLPDPNDRHVVAAAWIGRADVIVTDNTRDFPVDRLPRPLFTQTLDEFLLDSLDLHSATVCSAVSKVAERTGRNGPSQSPLDIADHLRRTSAPEFGAALALLLG